MKLTLGSALSGVSRALKTRTGKDTQLTFLAEVATVGIGFLCNVIMIRKMSVEDYGLYSLFLSTMMLLSGFMHFGWIDTFVRYGSKHLHSPHFRAVRRHCLQRSTLGIIAVAGLAIVSSKVICTYILNRQGHEWLVIAAALAASANVFYSFTQNNFRVERDFRSVFVTRVGSAAFRLIGVVGVLVISQGLFLVHAIVLNVSSTVIFFARPLVGFFKSSPVEAGEGGIAEQKRIFLDMKSYNFWVIVSLFTTTIIGNIDAQILAHFHDNQTLSNFGVVTRLTLPFQLMMTALTTTILPRLNMSGTREEVIRYLKHLPLFLVPTGLALTALIFLAPPVLTWIAGPAYEGISTAIKIQLAAILAMFFGNSLGMVLMAWGWSRFFAVLNITQLVVDVALDILLIPRYGVEGALTATLAINVLGLVAIAVALAYGLRSHKRSI